MAEHDTSEARSQVATLAVVETNPKSHSFRVRRVLIALVDFERLAHVVNGLEHVITALANPSQSR